MTDRQDTQNAENPTENEQLLPHERLSPRALLPLLPGVLSFLVIMGILMYLINRIGVEEIQNIIAGAGVWGPLIYIALKAATYTAAPLSAAPVQMFSGVAFGIIPGTVYSLVGELIGGSISFWIARWYGRPVVERLVGSAGMASIDKNYHRLDNFGTLLFARLFLFSIYDFLSYAAGLTPMAFRRYVIVSAVGGIIPTFLTVLVGTYLTDLGPGFAVLFIALGGVILLPIVLYPLVRQRLRQRRESRRLQAVQPEAEFDV